MLSTKAQMTIFFACAIFAFAMAASLATYAYNDRPVQCKCPTRISPVVGQRGRVHYIHRQVHTEECKKLRALCN